MTTAYIRDQYKGEVCNYRVKVGCGAPVFLPYEGGTWSSKLSAWNITYVEWEEDQVHLAKDKGKTMAPSNLLMPDTDSKFMFYNTDPLNSWD
jgi:hypothetical protein